jgi:predicted DNA binding CopG/RHH family protein
MKTLKKIPKFKDEDAEREFWATADSTEYIDWSKAQRMTLPNLRPSLRTISLRLPEAMIAELKLLANKRDVPYQSLLKVFLSDRIKQELAGSTSQKQSPSGKRAG